MILVTGGAGLLGAELITQLLNAGKPVKAIFHTTPISHPPSPLLQTVACDILDVIALEEVMESVDQVYHCAGYVSFAPDAAQKLFKINVEGTANVVNAALASGVSKLVHVSSVAALGRVQATGAIDENRQWVAGDKNSRYAYSKYLGEMEVWRAIAEGLNAAIIQPSIILGAGNWEEGSTAIFKSIYKEFPYYTNGASGFVDVKDVAKAMILLMESEVVAERFILNGHNAPYKKIFDLIADGFNKKRPHKNVTPFMASMVWRWEKIKSFFSSKQPLITKETAANAMEQILYNNEKFLQFFPTFTYQSLEESIAQTCQLLQQKLNKP